MPTFISVMCLLLSALCSSASLAAVPARPMGLTPGASSAPLPEFDTSSVTLSWNAVSKATSYAVGVRDLYTGKRSDSTVTSTSLSLPLQPGRGYRWTVAACNASGCSAEATALTIQSANPKLSISKLGTGLGSLQCDGSVCNTAYPLDKGVKITATAAIGSEFAVWSGCDSVSGQACTVTMSSARAVSVTFNKASYSLAVGYSGTGTGSVTCNDSLCVGKYAAGATLTIAPVPSADSKFVSFAGCDAVAAGACTIKVAGPMNVTAKFDRRSFTVEYGTAGDGSGSIKCGAAACPATAVAGETVVVTATPGGDSVFEKWSGCDQTNVDRCTLVVKGNRKAIATFGKKRAPLEATATGTGAGSLSCNGVACVQAYPLGTTVELTQTPESGSKFGTWVGCTSILGNVCKVNMATSTTVTTRVAARFDVVDKVSFHRMSGSIAHLGPLVYTYGEFPNAMEPDRLRAMARDIKRLTLGSADAATALSANGRNAQLAVQFEIGVHRFARLGLEKTVAQTRMLVNTFASEGIAVHLLLAAHYQPEDGWPAAGATWGDKVWQSRANFFAPYQPCRERARANVICPYDVIFENFHAPMIRALVKNGVAARLGLIYILNEFDYSKPDDSSFWTTDKCGASDAKSCRSDALANTAIRGYRLAQAEAGITVPIGLKFQYISENTASGWKTLGANNPLRRLLVNEMWSTGGVLGYDCYAHSGRDKCQQDAALFSDVLSTPETAGGRAPIEDYRLGRIVLAEYAMHCKSDENNPKTPPILTEGAITTSRDMTDFLRDWRQSSANPQLVASGFTLFGYNTRNCYALADPLTESPFPGAKYIEPLQGIGKQMMDILKNKI